MNTLYSTVQIPPKVRSFRAEFYLSCPILLPVSSLARISWAPEISFSLVLKGAPGYTFPLLKVTQVCGE